MLSVHLYEKLSELIPKGKDFAIAFSGGGDSTALVHALKDHPQAKYVYIVDHDLRNDSSVEAKIAKAFAITCGYDSKLLKWKHNSPISALQEKARKARYGLMGDQCRKDGIKYLLTAHSEDDQAETLLMRYDRKTDWRGASGIAELTYGPVWPQLAMVNIVRPLLGVSRQGLQNYNRANNLKWAEDPSNENRNYARIRARDYLAEHPQLRVHFLKTASDMRACLSHEKSLLRDQFSSLGQVDPNGIITLTEVPLPELMLHCLRCTSGQGGVIDRAKLRNLLMQMRNACFKSATLGGALVVAHKTGFVICRDPVSVKGRQDRHHERGEMKRRLSFRLNETPQIWDGRFSATGPKHHSHMGAIYQNSELLTKDQVRALKKIPAPARATLPISKQENLIRIMGHGDLGSRTVISLVKMRLDAALGIKLD